MKTVKFWKVETPYVIRYFETEAEAARFYNRCEHADIITFTRRSSEKIAAIRKQIAADNAAEIRHNEEMANLDALSEAWLREQKGV